MNVIFFSFIPHIQVVGEGFVFFAVVLITIFPDKSPITTFNKSSYEIQ